MSPFIVSCRSRRLDHHISAINSARYQCAAELVQAVTRMRLNIGSLIPLRRIELNSGDRSDTEVCGQQTSLQHRVKVYGRAPAVPDGQ